jgi:hypothetical protein
MHPMMKNYFNEDAKNLFDNLVKESINWAGIDCWYLPREVVIQDIVMNELFLSNFKEAIKITVFREETGGFYPNNFIIQKFGPEFNGGSSTFAVSKTEFTLLTGEQFPQPGDILIFTETKQIYQINDMGNRDPWVSGGKYYYWKMECRPYEHNKNKEFKKDVFNYLEPDTEDLIENFLSSNRIDGYHFFTADSTCVTIDDSFKLASEDMSDDYFLPVTSDREDISVTNNDWDTSIDWDDDYIINNQSGPKKLTQMKYPNSSVNNSISVESELYGTKTTLGF